MKTCFKCGGPPQPLTNFYAHPQTADGRLGKCKECTKKDVTKNKPGPKTQRRKKGTMKITKEKARDNRLDVLDGRGRVAELIEKHLPKFKWRKVSKGTFRTELGKFNLFVYQDDSASLWGRGLFGKFVATVSLTEGTYEKVAAIAPYTKGVYNAICALEEL